VQAGEDARQYTKRITSGTATSMASNKKASQVRQGPSHDLVAFNEITSAMTDAEFYQKKTTLRAPTANVQDQSAHFTALGPAPVPGPKRQVITSTAKPRLTYLNQSEIAMSQLGPLPAKNIALIDAILNTGGEPVLENIRKMYAKQPDVLEALERRMAHVNSLSDSERANMHSLLQRKPSNSTDSPARAPSVSGQPFYLDNGEDYLSTAFDEPKTFKSKVRVKLNRAFRRKKDDDARIVVSLKDDLSDKELAAFAWMVEEAKRKELEMVENLNENGHNKICRCLKCTTTVDSKELKEYAHRPPGKYRRYWRLVRSRVTGKVYKEHLDPYRPFPITYTVAWEACKQQSKEDMKAAKKRAKEAKKAKKSKEKMARKAN